MKRIASSIEIAAPPERVWRVLIDFHAYPEWNPFMPAASGSPEVGSRLDIRLCPPGGEPMSFKPVVLVATPNEELRWRGRLIVPGLFDGEHCFRLSPTADGTLFEQGENFSGLLVGLLGSSMFERTKRGFTAMNEAIKRRAERAPVA